MYLEKDLNVDDLIIEYMIYKVQNGFEPSFSATEFMNFLAYFELNMPSMPVAEVVTDSETLFKRFFERKVDRYWSITKDWHTGRKEYRPHMEMYYDEKSKDYIIKANYKLSDYDISITNINNMENKNVIIYKIERIIQKFLSNNPKRVIDENIEVSDDELLYGKYITIDIINHIWLSYIDKQIEYGRWPRQCGDISKYLLEVDLAKIIEVPSLKDDLLNLCNLKWIQSSVENLNNDVEIAVNQMLKITGKDNKASSYFHNKD